MLRDQKQFEAAAQKDSLRKYQAADLVSGLRGKDVLFVFVESYGQVAVEDPVLARESRWSSTTAPAGSARRPGSTAAAPSSPRPRSAAISWLAHSTLVRPVGRQPAALDQLVTSRRRPSARSSGGPGGGPCDVPANNRAWPQGAFYQYDQVYDSRNVGYRGPRFGFPTMPDQYTLDAFHRLELARKDRRPVMGEST